MLQCFTLKLKNFLSLSLSLSHMYSTDQVFYQYRNATEKAIQAIPKDQRSVTHTRNAFEASHSFSNLQDETSRDCSLSARQISTIM